MMTDDEKKPILADSGIYIKPSGSGSPQHYQLQHPHQQFNQSEQQHLVIQPIEFDTKHRNLYGYLSFAAFTLILINYIMIKERACQFSFAAGFTSYDLIQSFHMFSLIIAIIVFILSYFNFAIVIYEFKILFYTSAGLIFVSAILLLYNSISIINLPCVPLASAFAQGLIQSFGAGGGNGNNVFRANDGIGITVFVFDLIGALLLLLASRNFFVKR